MHGKLCCSCEFDILRYVLISIHSAEIPPIGFCNSDEADVFLEARDTNDIKRNALVSGN
jgi:hypothetical protein